jgi:hypothetical protein
MAWAINKTPTKANFIVCIRKITKRLHVKPDASLSFIRLHEINNRATPDRFVIFKHAILLHKLYNQKQPMREWTHLNFQHQFTVRRGLFDVAKTNNYKIGECILANRLSVLNNLIPLDWLNLSFELFKIKIKEKFKQS